MKRMAGEPIKETTLWYTSTGTGQSFQSGEGCHHVLEVRSALRRQYGPQFHLATDHGFGGDKRSSLRSQVPAKPSPAGTWLASVLFLRFERTVSTYRVASKQRAAPEFVQQGH
jgi:hypothetical protein